MESTQNDNKENDNTGGAADAIRSARPLGYWLKATDRLLAAAFAEAFASEGVSRRDWRLLNAVDGTPFTGAPLDGSARNSAFRNSAAQGERQLRRRKLERLIDLGWVVEQEGSWQLSEEGRTAKERLGTIVADIRARVARAVPEEDLATTMRSLEAIAREFGWDESMPLPKGRGRDSGDGAGRGRGFGPGHEHEWHRARRGGPDRARCAHFEHGDRFERGASPKRGGRGAERVGLAVQGAFERGFTAGFEHGRAS